MAVTSTESAASAPARAGGMRSSRRLLTAWGIFLTVVLAIDVAIHLYLADRLLLDLALPTEARNAGLALTAALALSMIGGPYLQRMPWLTLDRVVSWPAYLWMGVVWLALVAVGISDVGLWLAGLAGALPADELGQVAVARWRAAAVLGVVLILAAIGMRSALSPPAVRRTDLHLPGWPAALDGFRLVQISDLHLGPLLGRRFAAAVVERVNGQRPDLIAVTGDLVDGDVPALRPAVAPLSGLTARLGSFFVTGNHDYYSGAAPWQDEVRRLGQIPLRNERMSMDGDEGFDLAGVDDRQGHTFGAGHGEDLERALSGRDPARPAILLAHQPLAFAEAAARGVALMLAGHTHGGQIAPFMWLTRAVYSRYVAGLYREGASQLYVHRGTGFWGPPIRLLAPAEIALLVLRSDPDQKVTSNPTPTR